MLILIDTCTFLWMATAPARLSPRVRAITESRSSQILVSVASAWEIGIKWRQGRLVLPAPPPEFLREATTALSLTILPLHHKDPFDRMLIAQAMTERLPIASPDGHFGKYPVETVW